jgi:hypothetical protein
VKFNQIDIESIAEFKQPDLEREIEQVKKLGITFGFHGESAAFGGREVPVKLDSAIEDDYIRSHERVIETLTQAGRIGGEYYLLHSSETEPFIMLGQHMQPSKLVDFWGRPLKELLEKNEKLLEWVIDTKREFVWEYTRVSPTELREENNVKEAVDRLLSERITNEQLAKLTEDQKKELREVVRKDYEDRVTRHLNDNIKIFVDRRDMAFGPERIAYYLIAKYMEIQKDPLWSSIVSSAVKFNLDAYPDKYSSEEKAIFMDSKKWTIDNKEFRERTEMWVPAVSAKYIWGHLNPDLNPDGKKYADPKKILSDKKMYFVLEPPMAPSGMENLMRLANPLHLYYLAKHVNFEYFRYAFDFEHVLGNYLEPEKVIDHMPEDGGKYLKVVHLGWPTAIQPAHMPIYLGSEQHQYLYRMLYMLRQKGFKCEGESGYLIYERGSANIQQSVVAIKLIVDNLNNDTDPKKLSLDFYGVGTGEVASLDRQLRAVDEHARDPLKDLLAIPEEEHTFLGRAAIGAGGSAEKWKKRELR